jgi:lipoate-protein ligase A
MAPPPSFAIGNLAERQLLVHFDQTRDPAINLSREIQLFAKVDAGVLPEVVRFWVNSECLVRGEARSAKYGWYREDVAAKMKIPVLTRSTGGGVVFQDEGNLNWSFFLRNSGPFPSPTAAFDAGSKYIVKALESHGVRAKFSPPNRIDVSGRKVSGMAARFTVRTILVHGTLLIDSDLEKLNALCVPPADCPPVSNLTEWARHIDAAAVVDSVATVLKDSGFHVRIVDTISGHNGK